MSRLTLEGLCVFFEERLQECAGDGLLDDEENDAGLRSLRLDLLLVVVVPCGSDC
jgi:hypothetical protein